MKPTPKTDGIERRLVATEDVQLRFDGDTGPTVFGYAAVFNSLSEVLFDWNTGRFREKIAPGAFKKSIRESDIQLLVEHADLPLATTRAKTLALREDEHGLYFESTLDASDPDVQRVIPKMRRGDMNRMSFGFMPVRDDMDNDTKPPTRTLREVKLFDVSIVARPAYPATEAKVRKALADDGLDAESIAELLVRLKQDLELDDNDMALMRRLVATCQCRMSAAMATVAEVAPGEAHPTDAMQPAIETQSAPGPESHPLSWYKERLTAARQNSVRCSNGPGERAHPA